MPEKEWISKNEDCWYIDVCQIRKCSGCIRFSEMNYLMQNSGIPRAKQRPLVLSPTTSNDRKMFQKLASIKENVVNFVENGDNLYIASEYTGNGKTSWAIKIMLRYFDQIWPGNGFKVRGLFIQVPSLLLKLKDFNNPLPQSYFDQIQYSDLVIWDDIASTDLSNYDHSQLLACIDERVLAERSNIYTGNITNEDKLTQVVGNRLSSRIFNNSQLVILDGKDQR